MWRSGKGREESLIWEGIFRGFSEDNFFKVNGIPMIGGVDGGHYNKIKASCRNTFVAFFSFLKKVYLSNINVKRICSKYVPITQICWVPHAQL